MSKDKVSWPRLADGVIPVDFPVRPIDPDNLPDKTPFEAFATCGTCGRTWDDSAVTSMTPVPSGRCPFEAFHDAEEGPKDARTRLEELRTALQAENISYGELAELQGLAKYIEPDDVELLEAAGVPEHDAEDITMSDREADDLLRLLAVYCKAYAEGPDANCSITELASDLLDSRDDYSPEAEQLRDEIVDRLT